MPETRQYQIYRDGVLIASESYEVSDADLEHEQAPEALRLAITRLNQINTQATALSVQPESVTQAQIKGLAAAVADEAAYLRRVIKFLARALLSQDFAG